MALSLLNGLGNLICTIGALVAGITVTGAGIGTGGAACLEVLILGLGAGCLGCSSLLLVASSLLVLYSLLLGATVVLGSILNAAWLDSLLVRHTHWLFLHCLSLDSPSVELVYTDPSPVGPSLLLSGP